MPQPQQKQQRGLSGSLLLQILVVIAVLTILSVIIFQVPLDVPSIFWTIVRIIFALGLLACVAFTLKALLWPADVFAPMQSFKEKVTWAAEVLKPENVNELWLRGEDMRLGSKIGKISGLGFINYFSAFPETDEHGEPILTEKRDNTTNSVIYEEITGEKGMTTRKPIMIPKYKVIKETDGDWLFVIQKGFFLWSKKVLIRANPLYVSELANTTYLKTVNLLPAGDYFYPNQQWGKDILRIEAQHKAEAIVETHLHFLDLVSDITNSTLKADPVFQKEQYAKSESLQQQQRPPIAGGAGV